MPDDRGGFDAGQRVLLERMARGAPLREVLGGIVELVEAQAQDMLCSILLVDERAGCVRLGASPNLAPEFSSKLDGLPIGPLEGSCGAAAYSKKRVIVEDIATHPNWAKYRSLALPHGLRACWSSPIFSPEQSVLGTFAMYYRTPRGPTGVEIRWVDAATHLAAIAILRERDELERQARVRELTLLHRCGRLFQGSAVVDNHLLDQVVAMIPSGFAVACEACIRWGDLEARTPGFREGQSLLSVPLAVGARRGSIDIAWGQPFSAEERELISSVAGMVSTYIEREEQDQALKQSEERLRSVIEHTPDVAIQWYGEDGRLLFYNQASERLFGWPRDLALGKTLGDLDFFMPGELARFEACRRVASEKGTSIEPTEFRYHRNDGTEGYLLSTVFRIPFTRTTHGYVCMDIDLTARRRIEEQARATASLRDLVYRAVQEAIFCLAVEGPDQYRFLSVNEAFLKITGLAEHEVEHRLLGDVIPEPSRSLVLARYREAIATRRSLSWEVVTPYPTGVKHGEVTISPFVDEKGTTTHLIGIVHDLTARRQAEHERRQLEDQLNRSKRLEALGTLASGIAHDFNNVLASVLANAELALLDLPPGLPARQNLIDIQEAGKQARQLIRQILLFGRDQAPTRTDLEPKEVVEQALKLLRVSLPTSVTLKTEFAEPLPHISADAVQVHQVLLNVVTNAEHALRGRRGTIEVALSRTTIERNDTRSADLVEGEYVLLTVRDDGCGMDAPTLARALDPFFTTKPEGEGTGLGLSTVYGIMKAHLGAITVESAVGQGTTVRLFFPAAAQVVRAVRTGKRVLYVDDEDALVFLASRALGALGFQMVGHSDSLRALQDFRARPDEFDVVVTDVNMPGLPGIALAEAILAVRPKMPIVVMTGLVTNELCAAATRLGIGPVVPKPLTIEELSRLLPPILNAT